VTGGCAAGCSAGLVASAAAGAVVAAGAAGAAAGCAQAVTNMAIAIAAGKTLYDRFIAFLLESEDECVELLL